VNADWKRLLAPGIVVALVAGLYLPSLQNPLVWDDVTQVEFVRNATVPELFARPPGEDYLRPVVMLSYWGQEALGLGHASNYHAINILIHAFNAALLLLLVSRLGLALEAATAVAILFATHPLQSAAVAYVSGRTDLLALGFTLLTILCVLNSRTSQDRSWAWALAAVLASFAAPLSKEVGLAAPMLGAAACSVIIPGRAERPAPFLVPLGMAAVGLLSLWLVFPSAVDRSADLSLGIRLRAIGTALSTYVSLLVLPVNLHFERLTPTGGSGYAFAGALALGSFVPAVVWYFRRPSALAFALIALCLTYGPASGLVPIYPDHVEDWVFTPEHFMYGPLAAIAPLAVGGISAAIFYTTGRASLARVSGRALLVVAAVLTAVAYGPVRKQQADLSSEVRLYSSILAHSPSPRACFNLGVTLLERQEYEDAVVVCERCARRYPRDAGMISQLGVAYQFIGYAGSARYAYDRALELSPDDLSSLSNLASLDASEGRYEQARRGWERALEVQPDYEPAHSGLFDLIVLEAELR
jgi:hypothetical protein